MTSADVRAQLVQALGLDLVGPDRGSPLLDEVLPQSPSRWYLTGFLVPVDADESQKIDETANEEVDSGEEGSGDDATTPDAAAARRASFPSSMGLSLLLPASAKELTACVRWGDYRPLDAEKGETAPEKEEPETTGASPRTPPRWQRTDHEETVTLKLPPTGTPVEVPNSKGLELVVTMRSVQDAASFGGQVPKGTRSVSVFLVNRRIPVGDGAPDPAFAFQAALELTSPVPLMPRPNLSGLDADDLDQRVADLQYRDVFEYAVGHNVSTRAVIGPDGQCREVHTRWIPAAEVERVAPAEIGGVELGMETLAALADGTDAQKKLAGLVSLYRQWIADQRTKAPTSPKKRAATAKELLGRADVAAKRIEDGIKLLGDAVILEAFRTANRVIAVAQRRRRLMEGVPADKINPPAWRPFQLAFLLMNLRGIVEPGHADRDVVDLLFFPTGGGKTEAYLGLAAFTLVLRRLRNPGLKSAGLAVLMRYTLRLLTLDQLSRASTVICALELERQQDTKRLGDWPFEIGLWVGTAATPNVMGQQGDNNAFSARTRTIHFQTGKSRASPIPLEECPWCGEEFTKESFRLMPNDRFPIDLRIVCSNRDCVFLQNNPLPIVAVDEPIYRRLPCFMIATVDKFAAMPWTGQVGAFFGRVDRHDKDGFYGPCDPGKGNPLPAPLLPPDLVIQDELHLISGPMGTMVGLYEAALDELCGRQVGEKKVRPKIVASTATVRRARPQIQALFNRSEVDIFPPPGPDRRDSFFAHTHTTDQSPARLYVGIAAQGRSAKRIMLRTYLTLLAAAQKAYEAAGGKKNKQNPADPYMTMLGYFNSLRELGGARRIVEDEVNVQLRAYSRRKRDAEQTGLFVDRQIGYEVLELTSRVGTDRVAEARRRLGLSFEQKEHVDVAIATNMISVGLDIKRLGLMVVFGQPKMSAEYIQATSRVGRDVDGKDTDRPGLVVTVLNINRPRDRSHYERFVAYHQTFYRSVEATSVTPFSPRALDRGLAGTAVALARQKHAPLTPPKGATEILKERGKLGFVVEALAERAASHMMLPAAEAKALRERVRQRVGDLLDEWEKLAHEQQQVGGYLQYQEHEAGNARPLLHQFLDAELKTLSPKYLKFRANRSMRNVEPGVGVWVKNLDNIDLGEGS
jgi:hypothetical protein